MGRAISDPAFGDLLVVLFGIFLARFLWLFARRVPQNIRREVARICLPDHEPSFEEWMIRWHHFALEWIPSAGLLSSRSLCHFNAPSAPYLRMAATWSERAAAL